MRRNCPWADAGAVHSGVPQTRQNAFSLGEPLEVLWRVKWETRSEPHVMATDL
ncbi:Beta-glucosidase B [Colletotrichum asianum]